MSSIQQVFHVGIYGLIEKEKELLVIRKSRGAYKGLFDLPGGRPKHGESIFEALRREITEETGVEAQAFSFFGNFSFLSSYQDTEGNKKELYHIALLYQVTHADFTTFSSSISEEDVNGSLWISLDNISKTECSPLLRKVLEYYEK